MALFERSTIPERPLVDMSASVDVVFLLLIFFAVSTTFIEFPGLKLDLPTSESLVGTKEKMQLTLAIDREGNYYFQDNLISPSDLRENLKVAVEKASEKNLVIRADEMVNYGVVVKAMDIAKGSGIETLTIATRKTDDMN